MDPADVAAGIVLAAWVYECAAVWADERYVPTITRLVNGRPWLIRTLLLAGTAAWALPHFKVI